MAEQQRSDVLAFYVNGKKVRSCVYINAFNELQLMSLRLTGSKYGCGGGGCGACTVMLSRYDPQTKHIHHFSVNACLMPVCQLHGAAVTTVEGIGSTKTRLHPVQERIAKAHGSQCGFCTPGMVMSIYTLLRNKPQPTMEEIRETLGGNLCRCTGYRPIIDGYRTFCEVISSFISGFLHAVGESLEPFRVHESDSNQIMGQRQRMAELEERATQTFRGERMTWISPISLDELLQLKSQHPQAPVVMGNTNLGLDIKFKGVVHPIIISGFRVRELCVCVCVAGVCIGAGSSLSTVRSVLEKCVCSLPAEHTQTLAALLEQLSHVAGEQIRNVATLGGNVASAYPNSDLNPVLAAGNADHLCVIPEGKREVPLDKDFFVGFGKTVLKPDEIVLSVFIPVSRKGEVVRAFRHAPRKENALATVNAGLRVWFEEGSNVVKEMSVYYGGVGPCTVSAERTVQQVIGRPWNEATLSDAYRALVDEVTLGASAPGGKVMFRRSLTLSLLFRFYLHVLQHLKDTVRPPSVTWFYPTYLVPPHYGQSEQDPVGRAVQHQAALSHATGEAVYCDDFPRTQGELFLSVVTSARAHARITHIDVSRALSMPGVVDVFTADDIPGKKFRSFTGIDEEILAQGEVTCVGQMVCAVVADTKPHAKLASAAVKVHYEDLPDRIFTVEEAVEKRSFFLPQREIQRGDVTKAFQEADHIYEGEIRLGGQEHFYMETQSMLVIPLGEEKEMKVYASTQHPTMVQEAVAETLGIPSSRVSCHVKRIGGAFGGKLSKTSILASITALAAWRSERPVRCVLDRGEDMLITGARHPVLGKYKVGFMSDGRITAADVRYYANAGHTPDDSVLVIEKILLHMDNAYNILNLRGQSAACKTNLPSNTAFRGFGVPQTPWCSAGQLKRSEVSKNLYKETSLTHYKMEFDPEVLLRCWEECKERSELDRRRLDVARFNQQNRWKKRGIALIPLKYGVGFAEGFLNQAAALVHIYKDGSVLVSHGGTEMGQGIHTKVQQVASRELDVPLSMIHISETSTSSVPNTCPSAASIGTDVNGMAVKDACQTLYKSLEPIRKQDPNGTWQSWVQLFGSNTSFIKWGKNKGHDLYMDWVKQEGRPYAYFTYSACCSEVELDCLTGEYRTVRTDLVADIGRSINPAIDIGQIEGAFMQGLGLYTMEELKFSPSGVLYTRGPGQYKIPAVCDVPLQFNVYLLSGSHNPHAIYSSKGVGEPTVFLGCSVFFALKEAVAAARSDAGLSGPFTLHSPATPERACIACGTRFTQMIPETETAQPWALELP
uniref:FAD-binding PCMH-type domain-containing protein n=1 Tax=Pygocentrus nattereri TaxID=42514 RepID=A0AAR2K435_PYGNA